MKVIVGLGNPGFRYRRTRHNLGYRVVERVALRNGIRICESRSQSLIGRGEIEGVAVVLAKPQTYMNRSGMAVKDLWRDFSFSFSDLMIICDDLALPLGKIRIRSKGGAGGHKGLESIITFLGIKDFARLRLGIGRCTDPSGAAVYVLERFSRKEKNIVEGMVDKAAEAVVVFIRESIDKAMNVYNSTACSPPTSNSLS